MEGLPIRFSRSRGHRFFSLYASRLHKCNRGTLHMAQCANREAPKQKGLAENMEFSRPRQQRQGVFFTLLIVLLSGLAIPRAWAAGPRVDVNVPAGDAAKTISDFIAQARVQSVFLVEKFGGITTNAVSGTFEVTEALDIMLKD